MKYFICAILFVLTLNPLFSQSDEGEFNFDFEKVKDGKPIGWENFGQPNYKISLDSAIVYEGKFAAKIEFNEGNSGFKAWAFSLPDNYDGNKITLSGFIKTENVSKGYAGLWMRIDPSIAFDNMNNRGVKGTQDWKKYEVTLNMNPSKTKKIVVGGLLVGEGTMWLDGFEVKVDGKDVRELKPIEKKVYPADNDKEFANGSLIEEFELDQPNITKLKTLGLVWGFLKYYHPNVALGNYNWDYELFRILPEVIDAQNNSDLDKIYVDWIKKLGEFKVGKDLEIDEEDAKILPDLAWINQSGFSEELTALLINVKNADRTEDHYYIDLAQHVRNPIFKNENAYTKMPYPDTGFRILALYRYWNIIQYYFPYKNLIEEDWEGVLEEFIPKVINTKDETEYTLAVLELIARIHDTHANIWGKNQSLNKFFGLRNGAAKVKFIEEEAVVTDFYDEEFGKETGLKIGDIITKINNKTVQEIVANSLKITPASNYPTQLRNIAPKLLRTNDSLIDLEVLRGSQVLNYQIKTYVEEELNVYRNFSTTDTCFKMIDNEIAYLNNGALKRAYLPDLWEKIKDTRGLIIDIRNYPSDFPIYQLSEYLMPKDETFVKFTTGSITTPGLFTYTKSLTAGKKNKDYYKGKIVIIINEMTQSSAEFHTMAYRIAPNVEVIGSTTAGADGNVSRFYLPGGISTMISGIGVYYPDGRETQRIGIVPDMEIKPTIEGIRLGKDELLDKAKEIINGEN